MDALDSLSGSARPRIIQTLDFAFRPRKFTERNVERYGPAFLAKSVAGNFVMTASPEHTKRIFAADPDTFDTFAATALKPFFGERSVILASGPPHRRLRKLLTPPLHGPRLRAFGRSMQTIARDHISRLPVGRTFLAHDVTTEFTLDVIIRTVFGAKEGGESEELRTTLRSMLEGFAPITIFAPTFRHPWFPPWRRYLDAVARFDRLVARIISERRAREEPGDDVLSLLLLARYDDGAAMDDGEIRDQLLTLLIAGHETTAIALAWLLDFVHRHPTVLRALREKLSAVGDDPENIVREPFASAVLDETMRIAPVVTDVARVTKVPFEMAPGLIVGNGVVVVVLIEGIHRDPTLYPEPDRFRPERFLERKFLPHEFLPFRRGNRRCLGAAFSDHEAKIFLATLLGQVDLEPVSRTPSRRVRRNITMGPSDGVPMRVLARR